MPHDSSGDRTCGSRVRSALGRRTFPFAIRAYPGSWAHKADLKRDTFDLARAKALLAEAGRKLGSDGTREKDGKKLTLAYMNIAGDVERQQIAQIAQRLWRDVGFDVKMDPVDLAT